MRCPNIQHCLVCKKLLQHRGQRSIHESSSYFGQIVHNVCPRVFTWNDVDGRVFRRSIRLYRELEHKSPGQKLEYAQLELLRLSAAMLEHIKHCPQAQKDFELHEKSGVFLIEGDPEEGNRLRESRVTEIHTGKIWTPKTEEALLSWLFEATAQDRAVIEDRLARRKHTDGKLFQGKA